MKCAFRIGTTVGIIGLLFTAGGAWIAAKAVILDEQTADNLAATKWNSNQQFKAALLQQSKAARNGLIFVVVGSLLQVIGGLVVAIASAP